MTEAVAMPDWLKVIDDATARRVHHMDSHSVSAASPNKGEPRPHVLLKRSATVGSQRSSSTDGSAPPAPLSRNRRGSRSAGGRSPSAAAAGLQLLPSSSVDVSLQGKLQLARSRSVLRRQLDQHRGLLATSATSHSAP